MPQLDVVTFINQYIWTISSITIMVVIVMLLIIPSIKMLIEIRNVNVDESVSYTEKKEFISFKKLINYI
uniref:ATP synthase F0 subunit 8 n=1 Tax=Catostylus townsendi TaxID=2053110 RepID=UPI001FA7D3AE|nr:ATP synthase F0 subunit 8 [Catostylus townsendi]UNB15550.1 ATP synthase F0 subunit 8 [Catostylus townsendi]